MGGVYSCAPAVAFKPYGVTLSFTPVVQAEGRIQLHLTTEVTEIDLTTQVVISGVSVPGFKTRKNETTIELPSGGAMATAGLLTQMSGQAINGLPGLLDMPVLGALFRSRDYQRQETELLVIVSPYIVKPISQQQACGRRQFSGRERSPGVAAGSRQPHLRDAKQSGAHPKLQGPHRLHPRLRGGRWRHAQMRRRLRAPFA